MMDRNRVCSRCVMDMSDPSISFDVDGVCDNCHSFDRDVLPNWKPGEKGAAALRHLVEKIKAEGKGKEFDCIMGMSGGLDSSYLLHQAVAVYGLRPLVFHVDAGWNTDLAVHNIKSMVDQLGLDLYTEVIDWEDVQDFQLALFKSGTPHLDLAQDHAFFATMYKFAQKHKIKYILNGGNYSTECVRNPLKWIYYGTDMAFLRDIRKRFCTRPLKNYPWCGILEGKFYLRYIRGIKVVRPLNLMEYNKSIAIETLSRSYGWRSYPQKHFESRFTRFYESYWMPKRFGYDTRRVQYSSLIMTGQMSREEALDSLKLPPYTEDYAESESNFVADKLGIDREELDQYLNMPKKWYTDYANSLWLFNLGARVLNVFSSDKAAIKR